MNVLAFETCSAKNKASDISWSIFIQLWLVRSHASEDECTSIRNMLSKKLSKWHQLVYLYSTIKMMHGSINIRYTKYFMFIFFQKVLNCIFVNIEFFFETTTIFWSVRNNNASFINPNARLKMILGTLIIKINLARKYSDQICTLTHISSKMQGKFTMFSGHRTVLQNRKRHFPKTSYRNYRLSHLPRYKLYRNTRYKLGECLTKVFTLSRPK